MMIVITQRKSRALISIKTTVARHLRMSIKNRIIRINPMAALTYRMTMISVVLLVVA